MKKKIFILIALLVLILVVILQKPLATHFKIALFITEEFPQIPIKPLGLVTGQPNHQRIELDSSNGKVVADLYLPRGGDQKSAIIVAMGVRTQEKDKPLIRKFSDTMARLGYVVFWPRLDSLDRGESLPEESETFIEGFKYLQTQPLVNSDRISSMGFSVGSSTALVAASDPQIAKDVYSLIFFGGQFDIFEYLRSLASKNYQVDGQTISWNAADDARNHAKSLLLAKEATETAKIFEESEKDKIDKILSEAPDEEKERLKKYSPKEYVGQFKGRLFIMHDKADHYVPYVESVKLNQAFANQVEAFVITDLFEHVQPNRPLNGQTLGELFKLYGFLYQVLNYL
ncbi:alpha/beta hydrolase [Candidatus Daviesbacteria bacterium]|nr:alpha/beta hydrolase [Candidatus Daviesbacteria bacterium]